MVVSRIGTVFNLFFSSQRKKQFEQFIFLTAIVAFIIHCGILLLANWGIGTSFFRVEDKISPISAIYTPFSIILLYEIYLLIYYLPKSITIYLGKQYEIIALIMIRKIFEDLPKITISNGETDIEAVKTLLLTFVGLLILFLLIFCFYKLGGSKEGRTKCQNRIQLIFVASKKILSLGLLALFVILFIKSLFDLRDFSITINSAIYALKTINTTFFNTFFSALILVEVLLLLFTFSLTEKFHKVIRNSGFIISTILLKLSFMTEGLINIAIVLVAVAFGIAILGIYKLFENKL